MEQADEELKVLLIEDDPDAADMYRLKLERDGYSVTHAADGEQGLAMASEVRPDLIFLDIRLPKLDGFGVLEGLRAHPELMHTPVIILSNYGEAELIKRGLELGALDYLVKADTTPTYLSNSVRGWAREGVPRDPLTT